MPRLPPTLIRQAHCISPHAAALLPACRDLPSALNELRWIHEHVQSTSPPSTLLSPEQRVRSLCRKRGRGVPLQYVLGTQPFGSLEIKCRPGVLIPRPEPEAYTDHLATLINGGEVELDAASGGLNILDLCTGTGCIALLLHSLLAPSYPDLRVLGIDISPQAVSLARENVRHNLRTGRIALPLSPSRPPPPSSPIVYQSLLSIRFHLADIFSPALASALSSERRWDVLVANPPYVSRAGFARHTSRSVRNYEPRLAQVPGVQVLASSGGRDEDDERDEDRKEDVFYARLLELGAVLRPRVMLFEVGDLAQAARVARMVQMARGREDRVVVEIWRDWPDVAPKADEASSVVVDAEEIRIRGSGHGRSVFITRQ